MQKTDEFTRACEEIVQNLLNIDNLENNKIKNEILKFHNEFKVTNYQKMKSSLKFCVIAAREFDLYVCEPRASEWDIAAGHAILEHAGGTLTDFDGNKILYGKQDFKNPSLIAKGKIFYDK